MWLQQIGVQNCRLIEDQAVVLSPQVNVFTGDNASGKTSLIEALCILSRGRSFRTQRIADVIRQGCDALTITGRIGDEAAAIDYPLGITKGRDGSTRIRINHADVNQQAELSRHLPLTVIHPDTVELLTGPPANRRALLDWIAFYREADFHLDWKNYQRILKQRNACLRDPRQREALAEWTRELLRLQPRIYQFRCHALQALEQALQQVAPLLTAMGSVGLKLSTGFPQHVQMDDMAGLQAFFQERQEQELRHGVSLYGAHRGDLLVTLNAEPAARMASRGQLKLLGIALLLAQSEAITNDGVKRGIIALDDLASELDNSNQRLLYQVLGHTRQQLMITGTRQPPADYLPTGSRLFHVEHGKVSLVSI